MSMPRCTSNFRVFQERKLVIKDCGRFVSFSMSIPGWTQMAWLGHRISECRRRTLKWLNQSYEHPNRSKSLSKCWRMSNNHERSSMKNSFISAEIVQKQFGMWLKTVLLADLPGKLHEVHCWILSLQRHRLACRSWRSAVHSATVT